MIILIRGNLTHIRNFFSFARVFEFSFDVSCLFFGYSSTISKDSSPMLGTNLSIAASKIRNSWKFAPFVADIDIIFMPTSTELLTESLRNGICFVISAGRMVKGIYFPKDFTLYLITGCRSEINQFLLLLLCFRPMSTKFLITLCGI